MKWPSHPFQRRTIAVTLKAGYWCYELYHQLRILLDPSGGTQADLEEGVRLSGESATCATYNAISAGCRWSQNTRCRIPDIFLHDPLSANNQIFALEVKRAGSSPIGIDKMADDLVALVEYTEGLNSTCDSLLDYACLVNDNQCMPPGGSRHSGFQPIGDFLADGGGTGPG